MEDYVRPQIYATMPAAEVEAQLRRDKMPAPFLRRMRVINLLSAVTLRKIEDNMLAPFKVMDLHHVLDNQISQDAIIAMLENKSLATALETGNLQPLWTESKEKPLLRKGFEQGWIQRFNSEPFDPICVMLAMRAKLMLDVVDELGHSYDLLRSIGMGWIDFGEIPGEDAGDPDSYVPPAIDTSIDYPDLPPDPGPGDPDYVPGPGEPGYIPPEDRVLGDPGYTPGPGEPGYEHPWDIVPGEPGHVPDEDSPDYWPPPDRIPGMPGYPTVPGEIPGYPEGWDEAIHPAHPDYDPGPGEAGYVYPASPGGGFYGGDYGPGGKGTPGGPWGGGGDYASLLPPLPVGFGPGWLFSGRGFGAGWFGGAIDCCLDKDNPLLNVGIGYETTEMNLTEEQELTVTQADPSCDGENYSWEITAGGGELSAETGLSVTYTAPLTGHGCPGNTEITLYCGGFDMATLDITINVTYAIEWDYEASAAEIAREDTEIVWVSANNTPLTWSVSGTGFSLEHEETDGTSNVLHADETACGTATITVTGCDDQEATGCVRCTTGQWSATIPGCKLPGSWDSWSLYGANRAFLKTQGKYKQTHRMSDQSGTPSCDEDPLCSTRCNYAGMSAISCLTVACVDVPCEAGFDVRCSDFCCAQALCSEGWSCCACTLTGGLFYQEWICA